MIDSELRVKIRELMASGDLPSEPPVVHQAGNGLKIGTQRRRSHELPCLICGGQAPTVAYFWTGGRMANLHATCDAVWKLERERQ